MVLSIHPLQESCNPYCQGIEHMIVVESSGPESIEYMARALGYTVVHVAPAWEVDPVDFRAQLAYTFDAATALWSAYAPESGPPLPIWRVHLAPAVLLGLAQGADRQVPMPRSWCQRFARWCRLSWALVACCVVLLADLSHAQVMGGRIDTKQALATAEYMTLFIKVNHIHREFCRPPSASALPQTVQLCTDLAVLIESRGKPHEKGESCPAKP